MEKINKKCFSLRGSEGFTLIELLVVIAIIGIVTSVIVTSLTSTRQRAKNVAFRSEVARLVSGLSNVCDDGDITLKDLAGKTFNHDDAWDSLTQSCGDEGNLTWNITLEATNGADTDKDRAICEREICTFD